MITVHNGIRFHCEDCKKQFSSKANLRRHMIIHSGEKLYNCKQCFKSFNQNSHLKAHTLVHAGVRAYACPECKKDFPAKYHQKRHYAKHHNNTSEKSFQYQSTMLKDILEFQENVTGINYYKKVIHISPKLTQKPTACVRPLPKVDTFMEKGESPTTENQLKLSNELSYIAFNVNEELERKQDVQHLEEKDIQIFRKKGQCNEMTEKSFKTIVNTLLITATIDKEAAVAAVKTLNLNHFDKQTKVKENIPTRRPDYPDQPLTDVLQLTDIGRVARQGSFMRSLARRFSKTVDEGQVLERVRGLEPGQVQARLERRGARVAISMDWVVRLCMLERGEAGLQEGRDMCCSCG